MEHQSAIKTDQADSKNQAACGAKPTSNLHDSVHLIREFQRLGNGVLGRRIQTKLNISQPGDEQEQEADRVADQVMRMANPSANFSPPEAFTKVPQPSLERLHLQRKCTDCEPEEQLQRKEIIGGSVFTGAAVGESGGGQPLSSGERSFFEPRFNRDFGHVRIHTNTLAAESAKAVNARAYTISRNVVFGAGQYAPDTAEGKRLLAHELTHTLQSQPNVVWRSATSNDIQAVWDRTPTMDALLERLSRSDVQRAQGDTDIDTKIATLLATRPDELWLAQRIRQGRLGTTARSRPVEAHFVQGSTARRALVIAGVHGSERQGIEVARRLLADLATMQPLYTVIVVPSLFPDNAARRRREGPTPTNRNFPLPSEDLAAATAAGGGTAVDASRQGGTRTRAILPENIMLLQLIERFAPERIISIHGTVHSGAGGVFYDPLSLSPAQVAQARSDARGLAFMQVPLEQQSTPEGQERFRQVEDRLFHSAMAAMLQTVQHRDLVPALAAAAQIDAATTSITGRERRPMEREGETTVPAAERTRRRGHPSVAGNVGTSGNLEVGFFSGGVPGGISLGQYAAGRGISIFTVEPPFNLTTGDYPSGLDSQVDAAERRIELEAYADAVRTILLGT